MPAFAATREAFTPSLTVSNWHLDCDVAGDVAFIRMFNWGGESVATKGYRTAWGRAAAAPVGAGSALANEPHTPGYPTPLASTFTNYATTEPTLTDLLFSTSWNSHGGVGAIALPLATPWQAVNGILNSIIHCRNLAGVDANESSYGFIWDE